MLNELCYGKSLACFLGKQTEVDASRYVFLAKLL